MPDVSELVLVYFLGEFRPAAPWKHYSSRRLVLQKATSTNTCDMINY
jgi:hypothetical protein